MLMTLGPRGSPKGCPRLRRHCAHFRAAALRCAVLGERGKEPWMIILWGSADGREGRTCNDRVSMLFKGFCSLLRRSLLVGAAEAESARTTTCSHSISLNMLHSKFTKNCTCITASCPQDLAGPEFRILRPAPRSTSRSPDHVRERSGGALGGSDRARDCCCIGDVCCCFPGVPFGMWWGECAGPATHLRPALGRKVFPLSGSGKCRVGRTRLLTTVRQAKDTPSRVLSWEGNFL